MAKTLLKWGVVDGSGWPPDFWEKWDESAIEANAIPVSATPLKTINGQCGHNFKPSGVHRTDKVLSDSKTAPASIKFAPSDPISKLKGGLHENVPFRITQ